MLSICTHSLKFLTTPLDGAFAGYSNSFQLAGKFIVDWLCLSLVYGKLGISFLFYKEMLLGTFSSITRAKLT